MEDEQQIRQFLEFLNLLKLITEITEEELNMAISRIKPNKSPGPDGFSSEWYKTFWSELVPSLLQTFNAALKEGKIPPSRKEAIISVIPKEGKYRLGCRSYRQFSVLNTDYKLFTSILVKRVRRWFPSLSTLTRLGLFHRDRPVIILDIHYMY